MKLIHKIVISLVGILLFIVTVIMVVVSVRVLSQLKASVDVREHTVFIIQSADEFMGTVIDAETGGRGYLLTGDKIFLDPYLAVSGQIRGDLDKLRERTIISDSRKTLDALVPLVDAELKLLAYNIALAGKNDMAAAIERVRSGQGKKLMDSIRAGINNFKHIEQSALARDEADYQSNMRYLFIVIAAVSIFMLLFAVFFIFLIYRDTQNQLKNLVSLQTQKSLDVQKDMNQKLKELNTALRVSEEKFEVTLCSIGDAVMATDTEGRVTLLNFVAEKLTGWTQKDAAGRRSDEVFNIVNEETHKPVVSPVIDTLAKGTIQDLANHTILISRSGSECSIADSCAPIRSREGLVLGAVLVFRDVTERTIIEANLKKVHENLKKLAEELKRSGRAKTEFLANMSHELRTPLNSINGFSEVLYDESFGSLNIKQKQYVNNILASGQHLLLLINQILDMAKVEAGKMKLSLTILPMKKLLNEISMLVADMAAKKNLNIILDIDENLPDINADKLKVKEIIYNLLSNAVKFTPAGGKIGMRAKKNNSDIEVEVWDTGDGIAAENMEKIFEGFFRIDTPYSRVVEGTGLGLPLSKKLVELHGGKLMVESAGLNKGTTVRFTIPIIYNEVI